MITASLVGLLCCPETHQSVRLAETSVVARLNQQIASGTLKNRAGQLVTVPIDQGLIRQDEKYIYPVRNEIPVMLINEAIPVG